MNDQRPKRYDMARNRTFTAALLLLLALACWPARSLHAQQEPMYSQYMFNHMALNPAYAGKHGYLSSTLIYRRQWVGVNGAPSTQSFALHAPTANDRHGFGLAVYNDEIGITRSTTANLAYAFRIHLSDRARLCLGIQGQVANYRANFADVRTGSDIDPAQGADPAFQGDNVNLFVPNAGAGLFFHTDRFYLGASAPRLITQPLTADETTSSAEQSRHFFFTTGLVLGAENAAVKFRPSILAKYHPSAPLQFDLNAHFLFADRFWVGASYRTDDAIVFMLEWNVSTWLRIGYAYDYLTSELNTYSSGSHEFMVGFDLNFHKKAMVSPRYF